MSFQAYPKGTNSGLGVLPSGRLLRAHLATPRPLFLWVQKVETAATTPEDLAETDGFATLDSKLASALRKVVTGSLGRSINVERRNLLLVAK